MGQRSYLTYLHKVDFANLLEYNQSLTTAPGSKPLGSVVRALVLYRDGLGLFSSQDTGIFSAMLYACCSLMS